MAVKVKIYQFKITLTDSDPFIWRRVLVPANLSLAVFHDIVQVAMGWKNSHSYAFDYEEYSFGDVFSEDDNGMYPADKVKLSKLLTGVKDKLTYVYDMSNNWQHSIFLEKILTSDNTTPTCTHAAGACPPEDCGGLGGYYHLRLALNNANDPEYLRLKQCFPHFDPNFVDTKAINIALAKL